MLKLTLGLFNCIINFSTENNGDISEFDEMVKEYICVCVHTKLCPYEK